MGDETTGTNADDPDSLVKKAVWNKEMRVTLLKEVEQAREEKTSLQQSTLSIYPVSCRRATVLIILQNRNSVPRRHDNRSSRSD